jgi:hypothetical protein
LNDRQLCQVIDGRGSSSRRRCPCAPIVLGCVRATCIHFHRKDTGTDAQGDD